MITEKSVKEKIKKRFGTFTRFCILTKIDRYEFQKFFAAFAKKKTPERIKYLKKLDYLTGYKNKSISSDITDDLREQIKRKLVDAGGIIKFCERNKEFNKISLYQIVAGQRLRKSKKVVNLLIKLGLC